MNEQLRLDALAPAAEPLELVSREWDERWPKPPAFPHLYGSRGEVWWWDLDAEAEAHGWPGPRGLRIYHEGQVRTEPNCAHLWPFARWGTVEEAEAQGYEPCRCFGCGEIRERGSGNASRWQRGRAVRGA